MTNFKSAKEMAQALFFDNKKIRDTDWPKDEFIYFDENSQEIRNDKLASFIPSFGMYFEYSIYEEPKQPEYLYEIMIKSVINDDWFMKIRPEKYILPTDKKTGRKFIENDKGEFVEVKS
jgi:hypothetical protein